jgi:hypothetical protein
MFSEFIDNGDDDSYPADNHKTLSYSRSNTPLHPSQTCSSHTVADENVRSPSATTPEVLKKRKRACKRATEPEKPSSTTYVHALVVDTRLDVF